MSRVTKHLFLPSFGTIAIVALYFTPVSLFGCATRGLMALAVIGVSMLAAFVTVGIGLKMRIKGEEGSAWWIVSTLILMVPALLVIGPLG